VDDDLFQPELAEPLGFGQPRELDDLGLFDSIFRFERR
jgi:hypothetical protein